MASSSTLLGRPIWYELMTTDVAAAQAFYRQGEVHRLRGEFSAAEEAYRDASRCGCEPQPGLALLRLAQGNGDAASAAIRRVVGETTEPLKRARLLPAYEARSACRELEEVLTQYKSGMLRAMLAHAEGAVALTQGDAGPGYVPERHIKVGGILRYSRWSWPGGIMLSQWKGAGPAREKRVHEPRGSQVLGRSSEITGRRGCAWLGCPLPSTVVS